MELFALAFAAIFVNNVVLNQFYGLCPFLGVSTKKSSALSMGMAVTFVITLSTMIAYAIYFYVLVEYEIQYLSTIVFILVIASFVQLVEMVIKKFSPAIYSALGVYLPLITTNCAVLGVAIDVTVNGAGSQKLLMVGTQIPSFVEATIYALGISLGYAVVIFLFSAIREEMDAYPLKKNWQGIPIALITAFIMAMIFSGFSGVI
ncbi:electron transport complex protein RnfA [Candidatus Xianfuyuplasma coldseepsis]|uniref:Electron transport complex subunit RsxA n=1 Tax=Candidatus Xianfuyuplasma coldseepsis TaxID=2782163 RepID=A0A7L7KP38_9MOLU|nr:Rnf-Nqr domain containing protein [Xianfuyuplasma coldseepsis]QMS84463.1 electron transport complex subunit RsxA [Xianfuyuplasma coldseepsis]